MAASAIPLQRQVVKLSDEPSSTAYYLNRALAQQGKYEEATGKLQRATTLSAETQQRA
jgi:hypothetical protein